MTFNYVVYVNGEGFYFASANRAKAYAEACRKGGAFVWQWVRD